MQLRPVDVIDTGLAGALDNVAIDRNALVLRSHGQGSDLLRFHRSRPAASLGRHQALDRELRRDYCNRHGIDIVRRPTGGGALYLDPGQLAFSLVSRQPVAWRGITLAGLLERGTVAVAAALRRFGIAATFGAPNDVEVQGRKIASVFATRQGDGLLLHGSVLLDADVGAMLRVLRVPTEKLSPDGLAAARDRLGAVNALCAETPSPAQLRNALTGSIAAAFELETRESHDPAPPGTVAPGRIIAERLLAQSIAWDGHDGRRVEALLRTGGGTLRARAAFAPSGTRLHGIEFATDAQFEPADFLVALARALDGVEAAQIGGRIAGCLRQHGLDAVGFGAAELEQLLQQLVAKCGFAGRSGLDAAGVNALMPCTADAAPDYAGLLARASVMLVPYCAKPAWCEWRREDGCAECGLCEVGTAYGLARERNMRVISITNYEHLVATLAELRALQTPAYVGMCCSNFFIKRHRAFAEAGMPALLMDISGANCYELLQEEQAYAGTFEAQSRLDTALLEQVMNFVPRQPG